VFRIRCVHDRANASEAVCWAGCHCHPHFSWWYDAWIARARALAPGHSCTCCASAPVTRLASRTLPGDAAKRDRWCRVHRGRRASSLLCRYAPSKDLRADELDAVLLHEESHRRRRDPLRQAVRQSAADVCFYVPLLRWWARYQHENAELHADRAALETVGRRPLAGALLAVGAASMPWGSAAFHGTAELRVAQVLDDPLPRRGPSFSLWFVSAAGVVSSLGLTWCLSQVLVVLR
jgi:hypothetical protein